MLQVHTRTAGKSISMIAPDWALREPLAAMSQAPSQRGAINTPFQVLFASLIGTTIEFFDFYIY
jgi:hypothetical protein